jgi:uncharacterized protein (TIGR00255 family)
MKSMTAYSQTEGLYKGKKILIRIRSTNNRFLQLRFNLPESLYACESRFRDLVKKTVSRGYLEIFVSIRDMEREARVHVFDKDKAAALVHALRDLAGDLGLADDIRINHLLMAKNFFIQDAEEEETLPPAMQKKVTALFQAAVDSLDRMRKKEGGNLSRDIAGRLKSLKRKAGQVRRNAEKTEKENYRKIKKKVMDLTRLAEIDETRLLQEAAYLTERADITEELIRLESHIGQAQELLKETRAPVGKKFDFLFQELFREMNTINAKTSSLAISKAILESKSEVEKLREQLNNIE